MFMAAPILRRHGSRCSVVIYYSDIYLPLERTFLISTKPSIPHALVSGEHAGVPPKTTRSYRGYFGTRCPETSLVADLAVQADPLPVPGGLSFI